MNANSQRPPRDPRRWRLLLVPAALLVLLVSAVIRLSLQPASEALEPLAANPSLAASQPKPAEPPTTPSATGVAPVSHIPAGRLTFQKALRYGPGEGELGMIRQPEQPPIGPESFAVGRDGTVLVADVANHKVRIFSKDGTCIRSLEVPGIALGDVAVDDSNRLYVYDQLRRTLQQYDLDGTSRGTVQLNPVDINTRGYFHVVGDSVYFADAAERDVLVAVLRDGSLELPPAATERMTDGVHGESGRIYSLSLQARRAVRVEVRGAGEESDAQSVEVPVPEIVSARFAGEDQARRFYVQTERLAGAAVVLAVLTFSPSGQLLATITLPQNDYAIWTAKLVDIGADGMIVQFLPQLEQAQLNLFANSAN